MRAKLHLPFDQEVLDMGGRSRSQGAGPDRRGPLILLLLVLAAVALVLAAALVACGEAETPSGTETSTGRTLQITTPSADGMVDEITWDLPNGEPMGVNPLRSGDESSCLISSQLHDTLVRYSPDWTMVPGIAESWEYVDDLTLVFQLRKDATFWDGNPVTASDVVFSLQRNMDPATGTYWMAFYSNVKSIEETGPWEVTVRFSKPDEMLLKELGTSAGGIVEKAYVQKVGEMKYGSGMNVMGSGPYELVSWVSGSEMVLQANNNYWDPSLRPKVQTIRVKFFTDTSTITNGLLSGEIDGAYIVPPPSIPELSAASNGKLYFGPSLMVHEVCFAKPTGLLGENPAVRRALSMAMDRKAIAEKVFRGAAQPNKTLTPPTAWDPEALDVYKTAYAEIPGDEPDIEGAKALLEGQTGLDKPLIMGFIAGNQLELELASIVQQAAKDIGLTVELKQMQSMDVTNFWFDAKYREGLDMAVSPGWLDVPDPLDYTGYFLGSFDEGAIFNFIDYRNAEVEDNLELARQTVDPIERANLIVDAQEIYTHDTVLIPLTTDDTILFMNNRISGAPVSFPYMWCGSLAMIGGTQ